MTSSSPDPRRQRERWQRSLGPRISAASLMLIGLAIGFGASLYFAWIVEPVSYTEASPARLSERYQAEYILLVGQAFEAGSDWEKTQERLDALADDQIAQTVGEQLAAGLRQGQPADTMRSLALLARQLGVESAAVDVFVPPNPASPGQAAPAATVDQAPAAGQPAAVAAEAGEATPQPASTAQPSPTPTITPRPSPTAVPVFRLLSREQLCQPDAAVHRLEVIAVDSNLEPLQAAEVIVIWEEGNDHFFTGFQPERGLGYGDFEMEPGIEYTIMMAEGSQLVTGLGIAPCEDAQGGLPGGWRLTFQNTDVQQ
ncbi:MAG: hypothetical protein PVH65_10830 [Chloroflexota bacterium]